LNFVLSKSRYYGFKGARLKAPSSFFRGYKGAIFLYDVLKPENPAITMKILGIKMDQFNPAGLSSFMDSKGDLKISNFSTV